MHLALPPKVFLHQSHMCLTEHSHWSCRRTSVQRSRPLNWPHKNEPLSKGSEGTSSMCSCTWDPISLVMQQPWGPQSLSVKSHSPEVSWWALVSWEWGERFQKWGAAQGEYPKTWANCHFEVNGDSTGGLWEMCFSQAHLCFAPVEDTGNGLVLLHRISFLFLFFSFFGN